MLSIRNMLINAAKKNVGASQPNKKSSVAPFHSSAIRSYPFTPMEKFRYNMETKRHFERQDRKRALLAGLFGLGCVFALSRQKCQNENQKEGQKINEYDAPKVASP